MVDYEIIRPCCIKYDYERHRNFPAKFKHEWKNDNIIFDLVSATTHTESEFSTIIFHSLISLSRSLAS